MKHRLIKIIFLSLLLIQPFFSASTQPIESEEFDEEKTEDLISVARMDSWESDSNAILSIISGLRHIEEVNANDSDLQREQKAKLRKKKYDEEFKRIEKEYYNKPFTLKAVIVKDVKPEIKLTKEGQRRLKKVEAAIKAGDPYADYLAVQFDKERYKYEVETGAFEIIFSIPVPAPKGYSGFETGIKKIGSTDHGSYETEDKFIVTIILIVKSKNKALTYSKDDVIPLTGKVIEIRHGYSFMNEYVVIKLAE